MTPASRCGDRFHDLRHTFATLQLAASTSLTILVLMPAARLKPELLVRGRRGGAEAAGLDRVGRIQRGAVADLVLLNDDPLASIGSTERIEAVVANGRLLKRDALDKLIATAAASAQTASTD